MKVPLIIEIDRAEVEGQRQSCETAALLADSLQYVAPLLQPKARAPYKKTVDELLARIKSARRFLHWLELDLVLAKEVGDSEN